MQLTTRTTKLTILLLLLFLGLPILGLGQERRVYTGKLEVGEYVGDSNFEYLLIEGDTLRDGSFKLQRSNLDALLNKEDVSYLFSGAFNRGYPTGPWQFQFGKFTSDSATELVGYQYKVLVSGSKEEAQGILRKGKPHGTWTYVLDSIEESTVVNTEFKSTIEFDNGVPQKSFSIEKGDSTLVGRFLRDGFAHDTWTLYTGAGIEAAEEWEFNNGLLRKIRNKTNSESRTYWVYQDVPPNTTAITLDERYLRILDIKQGAANKPQVATNGITDLLSENSHYYKKIDAILKELGPAEFMPQFKVKVALAPLDSIQQNYLDAVVKSAKAAQEISTDLLNDTQLSILKLSDLEAEAAHKQLEVLDLHFVSPLNELVELQKEALIKYVSREELIRYLWPNGLPEQSIPIDDGSTVALNLSPASDIPTNSFENLNRYATAVYQKLDSIEKTLSVKLAGVRRQQELSTLEQQLIGHIDSLNQLIVVQKEPIPEIYQNALKNIGNEAELRLADYSKLVATDQKIAAAKALVSCFEHFNQLAATVTKQHKRDTEIQQKYTDAIWNPFMANLMDEAVKKRITTAYLQVLVPSFMATITNDLNCENASELNALLDASFKRMLELRTEETRKLERKLKREDDPNVILELFGIATNKADTK